ncbi:asparagine synthase (glutamine-hydrolyzing) [Thioalkalicoccus limnaeus]|uniref:asparagine synthase (glutamine-hydrolyzing) n=1 Tax=Thioalkalicoccus limnaeus TaxID=120681 RepID=A0ABV4BEJ6_9GAMM
MCGVCGLWQPGGGDAAALRARIASMTATLAHRGPDGTGTWVDAAAGIAFGHRRLAVLDLSPHGHQPMVSADGRYLLTFNGEIYNHRSLRAALPSDTSWRGHSDTEVLLAALAHWGVPRALERLNGMFAFALWDRRDRTLVLARDRLGEKPLYYGWAGRHFLFGSELKALRAHPDWSGDVDRDVLALFLRLGHVPAPYSIHRGIRQLGPGTFATITDPSRDPALTCYWSAAAIAERGQHEAFDGDRHEAIKTLEELLRDAVALRMQADVPIGAFLSGGIDSSTIVALMQAQSRQAVRTYSIGFAEAGYDEAPRARAVAHHLGTDHTEHYVTPEEALAVIPRLPDLWDEPFADPSQIPTHLVATLARRDVTVCLSGDGGDELFGGYTRYLWAARTWKAIGWVPLSARHALASGIQRVSPHVWNGVLRPVARWLPGPLAIHHPGDRLHKASEVLIADTPVALYRRFLSHWKHPEALVHGATEPITALTDPRRWPNLGDFRALMMYLDSVGYLPDNILVKVDRATQGIGLEARVPLLDHRVYEFAWRLPLAWKLTGTIGKRPLRAIVERHVPKELIERPKMGFGVPIDHWLRGPLRDWAEALLDERRLRDEGYLQPEPIRRAWHEHLSGTRNWSYQLWDLLMFQAWLAAAPNRGPRDA